MTVETFFQKFDLFADTPNAVEMMRELCVHLGVSGSLVANEPNEPPVTLKLSGGTENACPMNWRSGVFGDAFTLEYGENLPAPKRSETGEYPVYGSNGIVGTHDAYLTKHPAII